MDAGTHRPWWRSAAGHVPPHEDQERRGQRRHTAERGDPGGADDRLPVDRLAQEALPGVELRGSRNGCSESSAVIAPSSWRRIENMSVPTIAAAELRVTVERRSADAGDRAAAG